MPGAERPSRPLRNQPHLVSDFQPLAGGDGTFPWFQLPCLWGFATAEQGTQTDSTARQHPTFQQRPPDLRNTCAFTELSARGHFSFFTPPPLSAECIAHSHTAAGAGNQLDWAHWELRGGDVGPVGAQDLGAQEGLQPAGTWWEGASGELGGDARGGWVRSPQECGPGPPSR